MKIWIDGYEANVGQRLGSSQVAFELLRNLEKIDYKNEYTILLPTPPLPDLPQERKGWQYKVLRPKKLWTRIALPLALYISQEKPDIFYSPTHYIPRFSPIKRIVTIFDLAYLHFPQMFDRKDLWQLKNWSKFSIQNAESIITISNSTKKDIIKHYGIGKDKIVVAYPGYNNEVFYHVNNQEKIKKIKVKYGVLSEYIIFIGTIQPRKNINRLIEAFKKIENLTLVIVGKISGQGRGGWMFDNILKKPEELGIKDKIIFTGFVPNEDLNLLLNGSSGFILPSLWEGFGIPVVDAMVTGTPVIVSNISSLPEVVGKAGLLINPESVDQIEQAIRTITTDKKLANRLSKEGIKQAQKFSWQKMAKIVLKVFASTAHSPYN